MKLLVPALVAALFLSAPAVAQSFEVSETDTADEAVFAFTGRYTDVYFEYNLVPVYGISYEDNYVLGAGYQKFFFEPLTDWHIGLEAGVAARFGMAFTGEVWGGPVVRYDGLVLGDKIRISPALTFGVSAVTGTSGAERIRQEQNGGDATLLFYLAPEVNFALADNPDNEVFFRVHHRSGAWSTLGSMADGANAQTIGFRHRF